MVGNGVDSAVVEVIQRYLCALKQQGMTVSFGVLFGSQATGNTHVWSDIDLLVVSPQFDEQRRRKDIDLLWHVATFVDTRIEPIGVGERQWAEDDASAIIEIARRTGIVIALASETAFA
ncbi:MAG: nucleotidyltransferase domain-containing protein [Chloroflexi bacterium]|nr:nucleotidyltransferase domain-containing protein [Chloroflexota bacterium]